MSSNETLRLYHDNKYRADALTTSVQVVECERYPSNRFEACVKFFLERFQGGDILELGAGSGIVARSLIQHGLKFDTYTLSELSDNRLQGLRRNFADPRVRVTKLDAESIPDSEFSKYDAVIMLALIAQLIDPLSAMQRIRQMLRPGGFVLIETPNIAKFTRRAKLLAGRFPATASRNEGLTSYEGSAVALHDEGHLHYFTFRSLSRMLTERCGFSEVEKVAYFVGPNGRQVMAHRVGHFMAQLRPELFSEIIIVAYT